jgi:hypothetical protein
LWLIIRTLDVIRRTAAPPEKAEMADVLDALRDPATNELPEAVVLPSSWRRPSKFTRTGSPNG